MIRTVIIGFSHMHVNEVALYISERDDMELCAIAKLPSKAQAIAPLRYTPEWNFANVRDNYCGNVYDDYREMLDCEKPELAFILSENCQKEQVVLECAKRGVNVSVEKPLSDSLEGALKIRDHVNKYGIKAVVNWPVLWREYILRMKAALDSGIVGEPIKLRYINGHTGPLGKGAKHRGVSENAQEMSDEDRGKTWWHKSELGGGVYLDICCYGCFFSRWFLGRDAKSIVSVGENLNTPFGDTEDNFAAVMRYDGKMAVMEGTWSTPRAVIPSGPMVLCTNGVIMCTGGAENSPDLAAFDIYGNKVEIPPYTLGEEYKNMPCQYAYRKARGEDVHPMLSLDVNVDIMAMLDAAIKSNRSGREEKIIFD